MNLTSQYIVNPKSREAYTKSLATYKSIRTISNRLRLSDNRCFLKSKKSISFQVDGTRFKMLHCPRGKFIMGSNNENDRNPQRPMAIERPFLLGETEVTQELFQKVMGYNPSNFQGEDYPNSKQMPVENVTWYDALMFCNKLSEKLRKKPYYNISNVNYIKDPFFKKNGKFLPNIESADVTINPQANGFRLPYEKEWEYAAKAGTNNQWPGTDDVNKVKEVAWFNENSGWQTHHVKGKLSNEWGFYDMGGNVREWCYDLYKSMLADRVCRGGAFSDDTSDLHSAYRNCCYSPSERNLYHGFRVSASLVK